MAGGYEINPLINMRNILLVASGGAVGSVLRYLLHRLLYDVKPNIFPLGTFVVNIAGCFLIGIVAGYSYSHLPLSPEWKLLLITGFCGGFTTFSAFSYEGVELIQQQRFIVFFVYFAASICLGLAATFAGLWLTK